MSVPYISYVALVFFGMSFAYYIYKSFTGSLSLIEGDEKKKNIFAISVGVFQIVLVFFMMK